MIVPARWLAFNTAVALAASCASASSSKPTTTSQRPPLTADTPDSGGDPVMIGLLNASPDAGAGESAPRENADGGKRLGRLPPELIQKIVRENYGVFRKCYEQGLSRDAKLEGNVTVRFVIDRDGKVSSAVLEPGSTIPDQKVVECVMEAYRKLVFPKPEGGVVTVVYPIMFSPG